MESGRERGEYGERKMTNLQFWERSLAGQALPEIDEDSRM